jgi:hypothetical protein
VLIGISRTSKTPTSIYLANRGIKTANIPIVLGVPIPESLLYATKPLIVGLIATAERISHVRQNRILGVTTGFHSETYVDRSIISEELTYARQVCSRHNWPMIDVSRRSIEETAAAIVALRGALGQDNGGLCSDQIILASASPFRRDMLESAGVTAEGLAPDVDERAVEQATGRRGLAPDDLALVPGRSQGGRCQ